MKYLLKVAAAVALAVSALNVCHGQEARVFDGKQWGTVIPASERGIAIDGDECTTAIFATCGSTQSAPTAQATINPADPLFPCAFGGARSGSGSVWFRFIAYTNSMTITTTYPTPLLPNQSLPDTILSVYSGVCGQLSLIDCNDDINFSAQNFLSRLVLNSLTVGQTYYVHVAAYSSSVVATYGVVFSNCNASNDECNNPVLLACNQTVNFDTRAGSNNANELVYSCRTGGSCVPGSAQGTGSGSLWFAFTATTSNADLTIFDQTPGSDNANDTIMAVYTGVCGELTEIACNDDVNCSANEFLSRIELDGLVFGQTYYVRVSSWNDAELGPYAILLECDTPGDECGTALEISCNSIVDIDLRLASDNASDPIFTCRSNVACTVGGSPARGSGTMWFSFTPANPNVRISTLDADLGDGIADTLLAVYTGVCGQLVQIACNDDINCSSGNFMSSIELSSLSVGSTYYIQVAGWSFIQRGPYQLMLECGCPNFSFMCDFVEPELCGEDLNGGCYNTSTGTTPIAVGQTVCGQFYSDLVTDYDIYRFSLPSTSSVAWVARGQLNLSTALLTDVCFGEVINFNLGPACENLYITMLLPPGDYRAGIVPSLGPPAVCDSGLTEYHAALVYVPACQGDANADGVVNFADITAILLYFGRNYLPFPGVGLGDSNYDGIVDFSDVTTTLLFWNQQCNAPARPHQAELDESSPWVIR